MSSPVRYVRHARSPRNIAILIAVWAGLSALAVFFGAAWWIIALGALPTLPLLWDIVADRQAGLDLDDSRISWFSGRMTGVAELGEIDHVRLDTRWDFSVRATLCLKSDRQLRLPQECTPPHRDFETVLKDRELTVVRHHFAGR
ncbi:hypothetical protein [Ruegeria marina]|uniref:PH domain-containing protein n=1 Tax=Ruegeria marina TaxID=639004 RepID=A0A1G7ARZ5_9RHOB|nr:hypothetical protein [Ruegeria marina]SDE17619.1 hypothetical protein SAMN04488239_11539 [Ruegeria marina]